MAFKIRLGKLIKYKFYNNIMKSIEAKRNHLFLFIFLSLCTIVNCDQRFKQTKNAIGIRPIRSLCHLSYSKSKFRQRFFAGFCKRNITNYVSYVLGFSKFNMSTRFIAMKILFRMSHYEYMLHRTLVTKQASHTLYRFCRSKIATYHGRDTKSN